MVVPACAAVACSKPSDLLAEGIQHAITLQQAIVRLAPDLHGRKGLWSTGLMRVLRIDDLIDSDRALFTQPVALYRLGRYLIDMQKVCAWLRVRTHQDMS